MLYGRAFLPEIRDLLESRDFKGLRETMIEFAPADAADVLSNLRPEDRALVFRLLPAALAADIFEYLDHDDQESLLHGLAQAQVAAMLNEMAPDDRTALLEELPGSVTRQLIDLLTPDERHVATTLLGYPEASIGRRMTPDYVSIRETWSIGQVIEHLRRFGRDSETMNVLYVTDDRGRLIDDLRLREIILSPAERTVADLMDRTFVAVRAFERYDRVALPVLDSQGVLVGIVTVDDILDVATEEATEDIQKMGGMEALDDPYRESPFTRLVRKRASWLCALFIPLVISSGGNSGSQAATLIIRALALGEIGLRDWWKVMRREVMAGLCLGSILGTIGFLRIFVASQFTSLYDVHYILVAITVAFALLGVVLWGTLAGSMLPFLLKRLGRDPAVSSAPFVATLVDVTGLIIYFNVAIFVMRGRLL